MAQKFHFVILRIEVTHASRGLSAIAELLVRFAIIFGGFLRDDNKTLLRDSVTIIDKVQCKKPWYKIV